MDDKLLAWIPVIIMVAGFMLTWRRTKRENKTDLVATALSLVERLETTVEEVEQERDGLLLQIEQVKADALQVNVLSDLRAEIESAERIRLEEQDMELRFYCQSIIALLEAVITKAGVDIETPPVPDTLQRTLSILVVNQDPIRLEQIKAVMPLYPHELRVATSISDADTLLRTVRFDVVIVNCEESANDNGGEVYKSIQGSMERNVVTLLVTGDIHGITTYTPITIEKALQTILGKRGGGTISNVS